MWAAPPLPSPRPWPPNTILTITKPPKKCLPLTISAIVPHEKANQDKDSTKSFGNLGKAVLTAVKSNPQRQNSKPKEKPKLQNQQSELSGADVLWALQKAAATQRAKKSKRDTMVTTRNRKNAEQEDGDAVDYSNVRPLCIKSDWSSRMSELEKKLQELIDA